jgi:hypothetical protein
MHETTPEALMKALDNIWITGQGVGPGLPERYFFADNGTEFLNDQFKSLLTAAGISLITTSTYSPQQNGVNERNHATADIMVKRFMLEDPNMSLQEAVDKASWAKNSIITSPQGFSPFQVVYGRNPTIPGWSNCTTGALVENLSEYEVARKIMEGIQQYRIKFLQADADRRIQIAFKDRLPKSLKVPFNDGDAVVFQHNKTKKTMVGKIIGFDGPTAHVTVGQTTQKVPTRELIHNSEKRMRDEDPEDKSDQSSESGTDGSISEFEEIQEIRPTKKRFRKKSEDFSKSDKELEMEMVRRDKQREADLEEIMSNPDQERYQTVSFSDHENKEDHGRKDYRF